MKRTFPRLKLKNVIKQHNVKLSFKKNVDLLLFLDYILFLKRLGNKAELNSIESKGNLLTRHHIEAVKAEVLKSCRG